MLRRLNSITLLDVKNYNTYHTSNEKVQRFSFFDKILSKIGLILNDVIFANHRSSLLSFVASLSKHRTENWPKTIYCCCALVIFCYSEKNDRITLIIRDIVQRTYFVIHSSVSLKYLPMSLFRLLHFISIVQFCHRTTHWTSVRHSGLRPSHRPISNYSLHVRPMNIAR